MGATIVTRLQALADTTRNRLLLLLEKHELTVSELCDALQLPQSTTSRHLKVLADDGWVTSRADGASRLYRMRLADLEPSARRLWQVVREQVESGSAAARDAERLRSVLAERRSRSEAFFATAAGQWDRMRAELFGSRTELLPLLGLLDPSWVIADLGCGTGPLSQQLAPFVRQVVAIDASAAMLRGARARLGGLDNVEIRRGELEALPIDDGTLDAAFLVLVLPYVAEPGKVIRAAARALRSGGRLLVTDLTAHDRAEYRQALGHQWQGFEKAQVLGWFAEAGLVQPVHQVLAPDQSAKGPLLFTASARRP